MNPVTPYARAIRRDHSGPRRCRRATRNVARLHHVLHRVHISRKQGSASIREARLLVLPKGRTTSVWEPRFRRARVPLFFARVEYGGKLCRHPARAGRAPVRRSNQPTHSPPSCRTPRIDSRTIWPLSPTSSERSITMRPLKRREGPGNKIVFRRPESSLRLRYSLGSLPKASAIAPIPSGRPFSFAAEGMTHGN